jgi:hypothetical protein
MANRFNANSGEGGLPSGYTGLISDRVIPSSGIEDVDRAIFNAFDKEMQFLVGTRDDVKKAPVIFASGEKWALLKKGTALRDKNGTLILPLITIVRGEISQDISKDITGRGINQQTGNIVIKRKLHSTDRGYQNTFNRLGINNQDSIAAAPGKGSPGSFETNRPGVGDLLLQDDVSAGAYIQPLDGKHAYEVITIPAPQFFNIKYEVTFWTQYTQHMNQLIEKLMSAYLPQGNAFKLETDKGYWYVAHVDNNTFNPDSNFDDMSSEERIIRCKFSVSVNSYLLASEAPGVPAAARSYISAPVVSFDVATEEPVEDVGDTDFYLGVDDPTLPLDDKQFGRLKSLQKGRINPAAPNDPALDKMARAENPIKFKQIVYVDPVTGKQHTRTAKVNVINKQTGESVISNVTDLDAFIFGIKNS